MSAQPATPGDIVTLRQDCPPFRRGARVTVVATGIKQGQRTLQLEDHYDKRGWVTEEVIVNEKTATAKDQRQAHLWRVEDGLPKRAKSEVPSLQVLTTPKTKQCIRCEEVKAADCFGRHASTKDGLQYWCRACQSEYKKANQKACTHCNKTKPFSQFYKTDGKPVSWCKECIQERRRQARQEARQGKTLTNAAVVTEHAPAQETFKTCSRCKIEKPISDFQKNACNKDGLRWWCRDCISARSREKKSVPNTEAAPALRPYEKPAMISQPIPRPETPKPSFLSRLRFLFTGRMH